MKTIALEVSFLWMLGWMEHEEKVKMLAKYPVEGVVYCSLCGDYVLPPHDHVQARRKR